jgi:hypothetical protein
VTLVPLRPDRCPDCHTTLGRLVVWQRALLRHAGYGSVEETNSVFCPRCGWALTKEVNSVRPLTDDGDPAIQEAWRVKLEHEAQSRHELHHQTGGADPGPHIWCDCCVAEEAK